MSIIIIHLDFSHIHFNYSFYKIHLWTEAVRYATRTESKSEVWWSGSPWWTGPVRNSHVKVILQEEPARFQEHQFAEMHADMQKCNLWLHVYEFIPHKKDFFFNTVSFDAPGWGQCVNSNQLLSPSVEPHPPTAGSNPPRDLGGGQGTRPRQRERTLNWENWE